MTSRRAAPEIGKRGVRRVETGAMGAGRGGAGAGVAGDVTGTKEGKRMLETRSVDIAMLVPASTPPVAMFLWRRSAHVCVWAGLCALKSPSLLAPPPHRAHTTGSWGLDRGIET